MHITRLMFWAIWVFWLAGCITPSQNADALERKIAQAVSGKEATVGVYIIGDDGKERVALHADRHCPLQSVFKMHIALAVLTAVDEGKLSLNQMVEVRREELLPDLWSPLREENPNGGAFTIARLIQYAICQSDNVACDVLIRLIGTPKTVEAYFKQNGIEDIAIVFNEEDMQSKWENMFENWSTPKAVSETLKKFYENKQGLLSQQSYDFFWRTMAETTTGANRLKGLLPEGVAVAHKTGSSGMNAEGLTAATNDVGIVFLPDGKYFIISVFVTDSKESDAANARMIADVARVAYDHYARRYR